MQAQEVFYGKQAYTLSAGRSVQRNALFIFSLYPPQLTCDFFDIDIECEPPLYTSISDRYSRRPKTNTTELLLTPNYMLSRWMNGWMNEWRLHDKWFVFLHIFNVYSNRMENRRRGAIHPSVHHSLNNITQGTSRRQRRGGGGWYEEDRTERLNRYSRRQEAINPIVATFNAFLSKAITAKIHRLLWCLHKLN